MPRNPVNKSRKQKENDDEFHFSSQGSDDHQLQEALAKRVLAAKDKKKKDTERKFLAAAAKHVARDTTNASEQVEELYQAANDDYQKFAIAYASIDDEIRGLWEEIRDEYSTMAVLAEKKSKINEKAGQVCEAAHIKSIGKVKQACLETQRIIDFVKLKETLS